jgi:hypothetical protein
MHIFVFSVFIWYLSCVFSAADFNNIYLVWLWYIFVIVENSVRVFGPWRASVMYLSLSLVALHLLWISRSRVYHWPKIYTIVVLYLLVEVMCFARVHCYTFFLLLHGNTTDFWILHMCTKMYPLDQLINMVTWVIKYVFIAKWGVKSNGSIYLENDLWSSLLLLASMFF